VLFAFGVLLLCSVQSFAQSKTTATISGTILDSTQSVVRNAEITVTREEIAFKQTVTSDSDGEYRVPPLPPGTYELHVASPGFGPQTRKGVTVTVGENVIIDFQLAPGVNVVTVEVGTEAPIVDTRRTQQANTIGQLAVRNLPIDQRDYLSFALLAPGVTDSKALADSNNFRVRQTPDSGLSFYGSNGRGNNISVDGGEANDNFGGVRSTVSQEAVQEFQINRSNYSAELGGARGGVVNIVTKSGSNDVRGSLFGFFRNDRLDATDPFAIVSDGGVIKRVKPPSNRQQFGGTIGGPIVRDKTFWFVAFEQLRRREAATAPLLTDPSIFQPTPAQEQALAARPAAEAASLRRLLTAPQSTIDMFTRNSGVFPFYTDRYQGLIRLDHQISLQNQFTFRYNATQAYETDPNLSGLTGQSRGFVSDILDSTGLVGWTHLFSPRVINDARLQFNYSYALTASNDPFGPAVEIPGYGSFNRDRFLPSEVIARHYDIVDNMSVFHGKHSFKFGGEILIRNNHSDSKTLFSGRFGFSPGLPGILADPSLAGLTLTALQSFNFGLATSYQQGFGDGIVRATYPLYAVYLQDTWRVRPNLTLNSGIRYELDLRKPPLPTDRNNVAPRFGFAWDPSNDKKTTIRGGYGLFFAPIDFQIDYVVNALNEINGFRQIAQVLTVLQAANPLAVNGPINIFQKLRAEGIIGIPTPLRSIQASDLTQFGILVSQTGPRPPLSVLFHNSPDYQNPYAQQASLGIEREIAQGLSISASYVFVRGAKLTRSRDQNLLPAPVNAATGIRDWGPTVGNPTGLGYFRDPLLFQDNVYESTANSFYHGFVIEANKHFSKDVGVAGNYTFSKAIDEETDYNSDFQANDQTNLRAERALSSFDQRHKVVIYGVLQSPGSGWLKGFTLSPIFRANSGRPFNLLAGADLNNDRHSTTDRPMLAGRNTGKGPGFWTLDTRLSRRFRIGENRTVELLAEGFNLLNHLNYSSVNNVVGNISGPFNLRGRDDRSPSQPLGFTAAFDPRRIQLGARFTF
jgi:hypothetical protein